MSLPAEFLKALRESRLELATSRNAGLLREVLEVAAAIAAQDDGWFLLRAPGRVNLMGEHTDYNGLPVIPMAIDREVVAAVRPRSDGRVCLSNTDKGYLPREFQVESRIAPYLAGDWGNYMKAAVQALVLWEKEAGRNAGTGMDFIVGSNIPAGAGLSSSSALVVAGALAFAQVNGIELAPQEMADLTAMAEQYVGTQGGGMDQTVCLMARQSHALLVEFFPTRTRSVPFPAVLDVVIANTLVRADKAGSVRQEYNLRVAETRMAGWLISHFHGMQPGLLAQVFDIESKEPLDALKEAMRHGPYTLQQVADDLGCSLEEAREHFLAQPDGSCLEEPADGFLPFHRAYHVITETLRVWDCADALARGDGGKLGRLFDASHTSCRNNYGISCPELDALADIARCSGALGARLTGAGFGGCVVAICRKEETPKVLSGIEKNYYGKWLEVNRPDLADSAGGELTAVSTTACQGAQVIHTV